MPPLPGEERVQTVFADIHYYFVAPTPKPLHHRFDKGSYFYIYHNATRRTARLEIANNPGTPEQDAFYGSLDGVYMRYSYKFPTLLTLVVDPNDATPSSPSSSPVKDPQEWRLASADPRDQGQYKYRLHTLDIYFWTLEDAKEVLQTFKRILRAQQLDILDAPRTSTHAQEDMSPVVQQLENVAITDPAYRNGQTRNSQNKAATLPPPPPPPTHAGSRQSPSNQVDSASRSASVKSNETPTNFVPLAYNPAAPAPPEPIAHREKTPPPADAADGTGLGAAAYADHAQAHPGTYSQAYAGVSGQTQPTPAQYNSRLPPPPVSGHYGPPPPQQAYASPSLAQSFQHTPSVTSNISSHRASMTSPHAGPPSSATSPPLRQPSTSQPAYAPPPQDPQAHLYGGAPTAAGNPALFGGPGPTSPPGFAPSMSQDPNAHLYGTQSQPLPQTQTQSQAFPLESPSTQIYGSSPFQPQPHQPIPHLQPQYPDYLQSRPPPQPQPQPQPQHHIAPPPGGYAQYSYAQQTQPHHHQHHHHDADGRYDVHNQVYRPTEEEDRHKHRKSSAGQHGGGGGGGGGGKPGRLEETAGKVDKKVGGFLKRLEKRL